MAITTYLTLKQAVENWLGKNDLTNRIPEFISLAEDRIAQELRVAAMETTANLTISAQRVSVPTGFLGIRRNYLDVTTGKRVAFMSPSVFWNRNAVNETGQPDIFTIEGQEIVFAPSPDTTYTGKLLYWKRFTALTAASDTNWILTNARGLYLYGALLEAHVYLEDDAGAAQYAALFDNIVKQCHDADKKTQFPAGGISTRSEVGVV